MASHRGRMLFCATRDYLLPRVYFIATASMTRSNTAGCVSKHASSLSRTKICAPSRPGSYRKPCTCFHETALAESLS